MKTPPAPPLIFPLSHVYNLKSKFWLKRIDTTHSLEPDYRSQLKFSLFSLITSLLNCGLGLVYFIK